MRCCNAGAASMPFQQLHKWTPYFYVLPALSMTIVWVYWPVLGTLQLSFYEWNLLPTRVPLWIGLDNYAQLLNQPELNRALVNTALYIIGLVPFSIALPFGVAMLLRLARGPIGTLYRGVIFLPVLMAPVVVAVIWR